MMFGSVCSGIEAAKSCAQCEEVKPLDAFHKQPRGPMGRHSYCKECFNARYRGTRRRKDDPVVKRDANFKARYGLSSECVAEMLEQQGGKCAICGSIPVRPVVDHCHASGAVRGILCHPCNIKLPVVDDEAFLASAIAYLGRRA